LLAPIAVNASEPPADYLQYCSGCHGKNAEGDGPLANSMKTKPADLTTFSQFYQGKFPTKLVRDTISGTATSRTIGQFHGPKDMPVWGKVFRDQDGEFLAARRIDALVDYLKSVQK
jgi:mono/diheme cytochrome c family protein